MFDIGWLEMMVVAIVMIVIIGPKDLPVVLHTMEEAGLDEVRREASSLTDYDIGGDIERSIDPDGELRESLAIEDKPKTEEGSAEDAAPKKDASSRSVANGDNGADGEITDAEEDRTAEADHARASGEKR